MFSAIVSSSHAVAQDCRHFTEEHAAVALHERCARILHLALVALAPELADGLDDEEHSKHAGMQIRQSAAGRIKSDLSTWAEIGALDEAPTLAFGAEPDILQHDQQLAAECVVDLEY